MSELLKRNTASARVWTTQSEPITPLQLAEGLADRGYVAGVASESSDAAPQVTIGVDSAAFVLGEPGYRFESLSSSKGFGCVVKIVTPTEEPLPGHAIAQLAVRRPMLVYLVEAGGPSNSDRNLCENLSELLLELTEGVVEIVGRGTRGNKPTLYTRPWLGEIRVGAKR
jgi:hypothetical protein